MSEFTTEKPVMRTEFAEHGTMSDVAEASMLLREIAEPRPIGDTIKAAITRAARYVSAHSRRPLSSGRAEDIWRHEARRIDSWEMDTLRAAARGRAEARALEHASNAVAALRSLREKYAAIDPEFFGEQILAIEQVIGRTGSRLCELGGGDRSEPQAVGLPLAPANGGDNG